MSLPPIDQVIAKVREIAAARPDFIYIALRWGTDSAGPGEPNGCKYMHGDQPGCIFGQALTALGVSPGKLREHDRNGHNIYAVFGSPSVLSPEYADVAWCSRVQRAQDRGNAWGEAVKYGDDSLYPIF